jgi:MerR family transcriptional regulator/heat shock protein HspR
MPGFNDDTDNERELERERDDRHRRAVYVISVAAELAGVHPQTLRIYERRGLVGPARTGGGSRRYSDQDIALLRRIQELTADGHNLEGVRRILQLEAENERLREENDALRQQMRQHRRELVPLKQSMPWDPRR